MTTDERLERLERELTLAKRYNGWLLAIAGTVVLTLVLVRMFCWNENTAEAQGRGGKQIVANQFIVEDEMGEKRAVLSVDKLIMYDSNGNVRALLEISNNRPGLALYDEEKKVRAVMSLNKDASSLDLHSKNRIASTTLCVKGDGLVGLALVDERRKPRVMVGFTKDNGPFLHMFNEKGKPFWSAP